MRNNSTTHPSQLAPFLVLVGLCAALLFLTGMFVDQDWLRVMAKPIVSGSVLVWVWTTRSDRYSRWIAAALACCAVGDLLLEIGQGLFLVGLAVFLLGQILFALGFYSDCRKPSWLRLLPILVWLLVDLFLLLPGLGGMLVPIILYLIVIGVMMWRAAARVGRHGEAHWSEWLGMVGAILFGFSDSIIAINMFRTPVPGADLFIVVYWIALILLAATILRPEIQSEIG